MHVYIHAYICLRCSNDINIYISEHMHMCQVILRGYLLTNGKHSWQPELTFVVRKPDKATKIDVHM